MIKEFVSAWETSKEELKIHIENHMHDMYMADYKDLVKLLFDVIINPNIDGNYVTDDMTVIDDGDYQGTLIFILHDSGYQPCIEDYVYTSVCYGSCSCCDILQGIQYDDASDEEKVSDYMTLMLHLIQHCNRMIDQSQEIQ